MNTKLLFFSLGLSCGLGAWFATDRVQASQREARYKNDMAQYEAADFLEEPPRLDVDSVMGIEVRNARTGEVASLRASEGRVIFLNLWATWCNPCLLEMPSIASLQEKVGAKVDFYLLSAEDADVVAKFAKGRDDGLPYYSYTATGTPLDQLQAEAIPRTFLIHNGKVIIDHTGAAPWDSEKVLKRIEEL